MSDHTKTASAARSTISSPNQRVMTKPLAIDINYNNQHHTNMHHASANTSVNTADDALPQEITEPRAQLDAELSASIDALNLPNALADAIRYAALGPGKRLRPLLLWHSYHAALAKLRPAASSENLSQATRNADPGWLGGGAAAAIELIHAFSLVHDDLPGLDDDDLRRGRPTLHRHTSVAMAVLAGDAMLTGAFQTIASDYASKPTLAHALAAELASATNAMIAGQVFDTLGFTDQPDQHTLTDTQKLEQVHRNKTGALIRSACRMGVLCALEQAKPNTNAATANENHPLLTTFSDYADHIGLMFQIVDDLLDVTQSTEHLGKKSGKDEEAGKLTYPSVLGVLKSRREVDRLQNLALESLSQLGQAAEPLRSLCRYMAVRTR